MSTEFVRATDEERRALVTVVGTIPLVELRPGSVTAIVPGKNLTLSFLQLSPGLDAKLHSHPEEQAVVVPDSPLKLQVLNALVAKHEPGVALQPVTEDLPPYRACAVVEIRPRTISAKSDLNQNKTPEERLAQARNLKKRNNPGDSETVRAMGFDPDAL
jgi:hypothetical protein